MRLAAFALGALAACSGPQRVRAPVPTCVAATHPGVTSRSLTWNGSGWGAVVPDGATLFLREFGVDGAARGERVELVEERAQPARVALAWGGAAYLAAVAPHGDGATRVFRVTASAPAGEGFAIDEPLVGDLAMVARPVPARPAALFAEDNTGVTLRLVAADGEPSAAKRCPDDLHPRAIVAWREGFRAVATRRDPQTGDARGVDLVALDDDCELAWRVRVWEGDVNGRAHGVAADEQGVVAAFGDREGGAWLAAVDHGGAVRVRATRIERHARDPQVFLQTAVDGRRLGIQVVAVRAIETGDRLALWRFGPDALLRDVRELAASPALELLSSAQDPWGGGVVGYAREETTHGSARTGAGRYGFFTRVCP